jgi:hypothetical protein
MPREVTSVDTAASGRTTLKAKLMRTLRLTDAPFTVARLTLGFSTPATAGDGDLSVGAVRFRALASNYGWAIALMAAGLGLRFYCVRELLAELALFSLLFFSLTVVALTAFFGWHIANRAAICAGRPSQSIIVGFQRLASWTRS